MKLALVRVVVLLLLSQAAHGLLPAVSLLAPGAIEGLMHAAVLTAVVLQARPRRGREEGQPKPFTPPSGRDAQ